MSHRLVAELAVKLRSERERQGLTQKDVAALMGVQYQRIADWELGRCQPQAGNFLLWLKALGYRVLIEPMEPEEHRE